MATAGTDQSASVESSEMPLNQHFRTGVQKIGLQRGRLENLLNLTGIQAIRNHRRMQEANQEAENRKIRKTLWGDNTEVDVSDDMAGHTILGDVTGQPPVIVAGGNSGSGLGPLAALALGALGASVPVAGVGGYLLSQYLDSKADPPAAVETQDETVTIGLGRIEDYLRGDQ